MLLTRSGAFGMTLNAIVRDDGGRPVKVTVVYVTLLSGGTPTYHQNREAIMDQVDSEFVPYVLPVQAGTLVRFPNKDNIRHQVYSISPAKKFELPLYKGTPAEPMLFDKPGVVALGCNIHDWMLGYIYVVETPFFAKTGEDGKAELTDLPEGAYAVRVWHPRMKGTPEAAEKRIDVTPKGDANVEFIISFKISKKPEWRPLRAPSPEGGRYQ